MRCGARRATTSARRMTSSDSSGDLIGALRAAARRGRRSSSGRRPRRTRCCRCSRPSRACASRSRPESSAHGARFGALERRVLAARVRVSRPGSRSSSRPPACGRSASTRRHDGDPLDQLEPVARRAARRGADRLADDLARLGRARLSRGRRLPRLPRARRINGMRAWTNGGRPLRPRRRRGARPRARRATSSPGDRAGSTPTAPSAGGPAWSSARSTPSCSVTGGTRGRAGSRRWSRRPASRGSRWRPCPRRSSATSRASGALGRVELGGGEGPRAPGTRRAVADLVWPAREAELELVPRACAAGPECTDGRASAGAPRRAGAARAPVERLGVHGDARAGRRLPGARVRGHAAGFARALAALTRGMEDFRAMRPGAEAQRPPTGTTAAAFDERLRGLAPGLELAPLLDARVRLEARADARPDPLLGVPAADRGRPGASRAQAVREPGHARASTCTC